ncbi:MAG: amidohydrolase family protein [Desulfobacterales bacterium]|nr:MAG: amidohydrolase family protein [Desulfobacterales bacterium]
MINFPIIDTHLHLCDYGRIRYPWIEEIPALKRAFLLPDYNQACGAVAVEKMVFVQYECEPAQYKDEIAFVSQAAREDPRIRGVVAWAPLEKGQAVRSELEELEDCALIKGLRRIIQFETDPQFCLKPGFIEGVQLLAGFDWSFDICISHIQMANTVKFVKQCPNVRFILDHIGKPDIKHRLFEPWASEIRQLAEFENVSCKISGMITEADHDHWVKEDLKPYIDHVIDCFGIDRLMFGGDWPVVTLAGKLQDWLNCIEWALSGFSEDELGKLFHDNALGIYRIN